jgi:hypothetical protein
MVWNDGENGGIDDESCILLGNGRQRTMKRKLGGEAARSCCICREAVMHSYVVNACQCDNCGLDVHSPFHYTPTGVQCSFSDGWGGMKCAGCHRNEELPTQEMITRHNRHRAFFETSNFKERRGQSRVEMMNDVVPQIFGSTGITKEIMVFLDDDDLLHHALQVLRKREQEERTWKEVLAAEELARRAEYDDKCFREELARRAAYDDDDEDVGGDGVYDDEGDVDTKKKDFLAKHAKYLVREEMKVARDVQIEEDHKLAMALEAQEIELAMELGGEDEADDDDNEIDKAEDSDDDDGEEDEGEDGEDEGEDGDDGEEDDDEDGEDADGDEDDVDDEDVEPGDNNDEEAAEDEDEEEDGEDADAEEEDADEDDVGQGDEDAGCARPWIRQELPPSVHLPHCAAPTLRPSLPRTRHSLNTYLPRQSALRSLRNTLTERLPHCIPSSLSRSLPEQLPP